MGLGFLNQGIWIYIKKVMASLLRLAQIRTVRDSVQVLRYLTE